MALAHPLGAQGAVSMGVITGVGPDLHEAPGGGQTELGARPLRRAVAGRLRTPGGYQHHYGWIQHRISVPVTVVKKFLKDRLGTRKPEPEILASVL